MRASLAGLPGLTRLLLVTVVLLSLMAIQPLPAEAVTNWETTGSMRAGRVSHGAALLENGQVLVAGGSADDGPIASAELYDPQTGTWSPTEPMNVARWGFTLTPLNDGTLLAVGGVTNSPSDGATAERYHPDSGIWTMVASMDGSRYHHTATLLPDGTVLIVGGWNNDAIATATRYDPVEDVWEPATNLSAGRVNHAMVLLDDGRVMVMGGSPANPEAPATSEFYEPATNAWSPGPALPESRWEPTAALLDNGQVLLIGGASDTGVALNSSRIYNPVTNTWSPTITMPVPAIGQRAAKLPDGTVLVAGGSSGTPVYTVLAHTAIFNPSTQSWLTTGSLTTQRRAHTLTVLASGGVLAVGGYPDNGFIPTTSAEHFPPNTPPVNKAPTSSLLMGALQQTTIPITIVWSANDPDGIASYQLQQRLNGGEFSNVALPTPLTKSIVRQLDPAATHRFRVSATDQRGATSAYTIGKPLSIVVQQEDSASIVFTGAWTANANASFYGGGARTASSPASATLTFSGTSVSWVTSKGPGRGKAEVWLDGVKRATIDLYTPTARNRQVVFARNGLAAGNHTIEIRPLGTKNAASTGTGVVFDAIVVLP